ncbi:hypothetical protein B0H65DRAFT_456832 [Neurospora tetraspora]|uniref:Uncharacterized protein n=1 Tax=Neurospora tetraspora TaxID=94610 RepID=A0AAE0JKG5_9PEZI|nr:hypothetical protein B0H65DRAFT_456832 [Neurospora tetraspora]
MPHPSYDHHALDGEESDDDDQHSISLDDKEPLNQENPPPARSYSKIRLCLAIVVILSFALILISFLNHVLSQSKDSPEVSHHQSLEDCGLSPTSARQSNCVFDPVLMGWVPIRCHDADLASEFLSRKELGVFYRDEDHNSTMLLEEVMAGEWEYVCLVGVSGFALYV